MAEIGRDGERLEDHEVRWRDRQALLESKGYMLRSRLHPEWVPSWTTTPRNPTACEDFEPLPLRPDLVDATRIVDNQLVYVKRVATGGEELKIAQFLNREVVRNDSHNHSVPVLEVFQDDEDPAISYLVMPFLRLMDDPPFSHVNDVLEFVDQTLEGLVFMHSQGVAHRDCARKNLMMDSSAIYPKGYHPVQLDYTPDFTARAPMIPRLGVWPPVKYYFVDYGISVRAPTGEQALVIGDLGIDQEVPELSRTVLYDPFKVDVFIIGNVFKKELCEKYTNLDFLKPLAETMTAKRPEGRPDAEDVLKQWYHLRAGISFMGRGGVLRPTNAQGSPPIIFDIIAFLRLGILLSRRMMAWTLHWLKLTCRD
ncbi:hypothetical protein PHLGIDRAFT_111478 [Phlebiopsis gigantea 11061_1 CR5-6]|uniref:Protein kinase domain-containing protein n=1 Tax=Phlebiopsis gigantea (strain 11061_1 CR5-6) TaxID=745531 RepID=A0A0C3PCR4_PHLG1|nr:hypothetical protein PHLGIDRAFT_111478 [Phlebiopsis gigantea 11061_1 CR5-6]